MACYFVAVPVEFSWRWMIVSSVPTLALQNIGRDAVGNPCRCFLGGIAYGGLDLFVTEKYADEKETFVDPQSLEGNTVLLTPWNPYGGV